MRRTWLLGVGALLVAAGLVPVAPNQVAARTEPLLVDLSTHTIEIDSSFAGTSILLFGATDAPGDVIVTVRGPVSPTVVRRKRRAFGIWVNRDAVAFRDVPQYYAIASSDPIDDLLAPELLDRHQIGIDHVLLNAIWSRTEDKIQTYREALRGTRKREELYLRAVGGIQFIDDSLFRAELKFPANVPVGTYLARAFLVQDGEVISTKSMGLLVEKKGLSADLFGFAREHGAYYGLIAIAAALMAGWIGSLVFRKSA